VKPEHENGNKVTEAALVTISSKSEKSISIDYAQTTSIFTKTSTTMAVFPINLADLNLNLIFIVFIAALFSILVITVISFIIYCIYSKRRQEPLNIDLELTLVLYQNLQNQMLNIVVRVKRIFMEIFVFISKMNTNL